MRFGASPVGWLCAIGIACPRHQSTFNSYEVCGNPGRNGSWTTDHICEVNSIKHPDTFYKINIHPDATPEERCSHGCMANSDGCCPHFLGGTRALDNVRYAEMVAKDQTLDGWADQLGVPRQMVSVLDDETVRAGRPWIA